MLALRIASSNVTKPWSRSSFSECRIMARPPLASATPGPWEMERAGGVFVEQVIRPTGLIDPPVEIRPVSGQTRNQVDDVIDEVKATTRAG